MASVLIIGASRGIGLEFARQYAEAGDKVTGTYRKDAGAAALRKVGAKALHLDLLDARSRDELIEQLDDQRFDVIVLSAGVYGPRTAGGEVPDPDEFDRVMHTN